MTEIQNTEYTAYAVATLINQILEDQGIDRTIPPQMMYNYTKNGLIAKRTKGMSAKGLKYTATEVTEFLNKWFSKNYKIENISSVNTPATLVDPFAEFTGEDPQLELELEETN